jgi:homoserine kinase
VLLTEDLHRVVCATAPGSIGNFGPGFDIIGCAITGPRDAVEARFTKTAGVNVAVAGHPELPTDPKLHASAIAVRKVLSMAGRDECGITLTVTKQLPLSGGQGGSAASAVAGALAVNALLGFPLDHDALLLAALHAESTLAGRHLDNVASALLGGIVLVRGIDPPEVIRLPAPRELRIALVLPQQRLRTVDARAVLPREVSRDVALTQAANVATLLHALHTGDLELLGRAMNDQIAEPARAPLLPGFIEAKRAAMRAGALGCSISGAGPTAFALAADEANAERLVDAMCAAYKGCGVAASGRVARIDERGASVEADDTAAV